MKKIQKGVTERMSPPPLPPPPSSPPPNYAKQETKIGRSPSPSPAPCTSAAARPVASFPEPSPSPRSSTKKHFASMSEMKSTQDHDVPHAGSDLAPSSPVEESETLSDFLRSARLPFELEVPLKEMGATLAIDLLDLEDEDIMDLRRESWVTIRHQRHHRSYQTGHTPSTPNIQNQYPSCSRSAS